MVSSTKFVNKLGLAPKVNPVMTTNPTVQPTYTAMTTAMPAVSTVSQTGLPQTGLLGAESAINAGLGSSTSQLNNTIGAVSSPDAYTLGGSNAATLQANLSGANGPQAAQTALNNFQQSPATKYLMDQSQRSIERSAAARGGLLGGNTLRALQENAIGLASQDFQNQFANLGTVADRGANIQTLKDQLRASLSRDIAGNNFSSGINKAGLRMDAGQAIANNATTAASQISQLLNQQGISVSDMVSKDISTLADIIYQSGIQQNLNTSNLASILANIAGGQASTVAQGNAQIGAANAAGTIGTSNAIQNGITQAIATGLIG